MEDRHVSYIFDLHDDICHHIGFQFYPRLSIDYLSNGNRSNLIHEVQSGFYTQYVFIIR